jgi:hypothetical protein
MKFKIGSHEYQLFIGFQDDNAHRLAFDALVKKTFDLSFENWFAAGYWNKKYIPYTLFDGKNAAANVSV